jgi:alpha 1,2-mannosyltransferase
VRAIQSAWFAFFISTDLTLSISRHPAIEKLDYYWRIEAGTEYVCPITFDPFQYMKDNNKKVSFSMALYEYHETLPTLWDTVKKFAAEHPEWVVENKEGSGSLWPFVTDGNSADFNRCHFWSNFQV